MGMAGEPKAFPFRGIERLENSPVDCFQRDGAGRPAEGGPRSGSDEVGLPAVSMVCVRPFKRATSSVFR